MSLEPNNSRIINGYQTPNLNKATYLLMCGAMYRGCRVDGKGIATFILDNVNKRHRDAFWDDALMVELWTFFRLRKELKDKVRQKITSRNNTNQ